MNQRVKAGQEEAKNCFAEKYRQVPFTSNQLPGEVSAGCIACSPTQGKDGLKQGPKVV
jgi:hypothetical protein